MKSSLSSKKTTIEQLYPVFAIILLIYVIVLLFGLFGFPQSTLQNLFSGVTDFLSVGDLYKNIGKPPIDDSSVPNESAYQ
jgi:hypothetical protein